MPPHPARDCDRRKLRGRFNHRRYDPGKGCEPDVYMHVSPTAEPRFAPGQHALEQLEQEEERDNGHGSDTDTLYWPKNPLFERSATQSISNDQHRAAERTTKGKETESDRRPGDQATHDDLRSMGESRKFGRPWLGGQPTRSHRGSVPQTGKNRQSRSR
jgi:hypothetical protein